jgi:hypothetical protein
VKILLRCLCCLLLATLTLAEASAQQPTPASEAAAIPEMKKLQDAFVGEWKTTETMERSEFFPKGGGREGIARFRLGAGGLTLIGEGHSDGSVGKLEYLILVWWDPAQGLYQYFTCFNDPRKPCQIRGTAHWEGNNFVNDYESTATGKRTKWRDTFTDITQNSFTLVAAMQMENGSMRTLITTRNVRQKTRPLPPI